MKTALMIAEKPSLAQTIAVILSNNKLQTRKGSCLVHEWSDTFDNSPTRFKMTSVCGHVYGLDFLSKYNDWGVVDPAELFHCPTEKREANKNLNIPSFLSHEAKGADFLILWLDCDKEGENICFEVIDCVRNAMKLPRDISLAKKIVYRAHFSALSEKDIKLAFKNLGFPNENESRSVDARQELDLRIGCAFTRFQTKFFRDKYGSEDFELLSYGPCQTPTLGFCVERHDQIQGFKPEPYWTLSVKTKVSESELRLSWGRVRSFDKEVAQLFFNRVKVHSEAKIVKISSKEKSKSRPLALNTVEMLRSCSSGLGMGPQHTMQLAERLYTSGYISYPRTETTHYPENFDIKATVKMLERVPELAEDVRSLMRLGVNRPKKGHDAGDHPPITPMKAMSFGDMDPESFRLYIFIVQHFLATVHYDCKYLSTTLEAVIGSEIFSCTGVTPINPGYTSILTWQGLDSHSDRIPEAREGQILPIIEVKMLDKETTPPEYLTESELITLMEKHGIGTDASIPVHINNICVRNYVTVESGRKLKPTTLGVVLVHGYQKANLVLPTMRSAVEEQLNLIAAGKADFSAILRHTLDVFLNKFIYFVKSIDAMDELFEVSFSKLADSGKPFCRCGKCRRYMKLITARPTRLFCVNCDETYALPQDGNIKLYKELKCPIDDFELLTVSNGPRGKSYAFCPFCFNHPPFKDMKKGDGCNLCVHPTCPHSVITNGVTACPDCDSGLLALDPSSGPNWKLGCNRCNVILRVFTDASRVCVRDNETCEECNSQKVSVEYKEGKSKLPDGSTDATGCLFCSAEFSNLVEKHRAIRGKQSGKGRGRGRGRGGSRGRGKPRIKDKMTLLDREMEEDNFFLYDHESGREFLKLYASHAALGPMANWRMLAIHEELQTKVLQKKFPIGFLWEFLNTFAFVDAVNAKHRYTMRPFKFLNELKPIQPFRWQVHGVDGEAVKEQRELVIETPPSRSRLSKNSKTTERRRDARRRKDDQVELDSQLVLRVPEDVAGKIRKVIYDPIIAEKLNMKIDNDLRKVTVRFEDEVLHGKVVDLPTITECMKTIDRKNFYKTADIVQMIVCQRGEEPVQEDDSAEKPRKKDPNKVDKKFLWPHGITPPLKNVRKRRFRKTLRKKYHDAPEVEKEVKRLFQVDVEAVSVKYEVVVDEEIPKGKQRNQQGPSSSQDYGLNEDSSSRLDVADNEDSNSMVIKPEIGEHDIFGEALSDSDEEQVPSVSARPPTGLTDEDSRMSLDDSASMGKLMKDETSSPTPSTPSKGKFTFEGLSGNRASPSTSSPKDRRVALTERIESLQRELTDLAVKRRSQEQNLTLVENTALRQRFQVILDAIAQEENEKEAELAELRRRLSLM
ncbi:unnamed protein product [Notodromas monacha]|uniref:DNA topoisomerase n=1 Tax=Notodromas monacha TaxID=399045 RepID=A0A7R9GI20_9CRUS|nr:unnamed protein product [Notodromas monacha]CAG0921960.1 unnamed protein product [Notodromas monacha]